MTKIDKYDLSEKEKKAILTKINMAYKRFEEPLELSLKAFYLIAPFGLVNILTTNSEDSNLKRFQKNKYLKKIKQYYTFSAIGIIAYILIAIITGIILRYYL